jgi:hypothetical protein
MQLWNSCCSNREIPKHFATGKTKQVIRYKYIYCAKGKIKYVNYIIK